MNFTIARKNGSGAIVWSEDQIRYIISEYVDKDKTLKELAQQFQTQPQSIRNLLRKQNIEITDKKIRNYPRNSHYFDNIDTREKAYWLGVMFSDGSVGAKNNVVALALKDLEHIEKFRKAIEASANKITTVTDNRFSQQCIYYRFSIHDSGLKQGLIQNGCIPNKSYELFHYPNIPSEFDWDFIRGYFDGDGSLGFSNNKYRISFVGNKQFLEDLKIKLGKPKLSLCQNSVSKITYELKICGVKDVERILSNMYNNVSEHICLKRKYEIYKKCLIFLQARHA